MLLTLPHISVEYITAPLTGAPVDIVGDPVQVALAPYATAVETVTWAAAEWDPDADTTIRWLYGGDLDPGMYTLWSKVTDNPEIPVKKHGHVLLT